VVNDVGHRIAEAAGGVHGDEHERGIAVRSLGETCINIVRKDRCDDAIEFECEDEGG
jgi:hypothetical protein